MHKIPQDTDDVNEGIPGPTEPRWVVAVLDYGPWEDRRYGRDPELVRILNPKTGGAASRYDSDTWADFDRAKNACGIAMFQDDGHELLDYMNRPVFMDDDARLHFSDGTPVPESAEGL